MYALVLDIGVLAILVMFALVGYKNGIFKSFLSFISTMFSGIFSVYISGALSKRIYFGIIAPRIESEVEIPSANPIFSLFSPWFTKLLCELRITPDEINHIIVNSNLDPLSYKISELLYPMITNILKAILVPVIFILLSLFVNIFLRCISKLFRINFLKSTNSLAGMAFGLLKGYFVLTILICCLKAFILTDGNLPEIFSLNNISSTVIFKEIYNNNFIYAFYKKI